MDGTTNGSSSSSKTGLIIGAIVLVLVAGAGYYFWSQSQMSNSQTSQADSMTNTTPETTNTGTGTTMASPNTTAASGSGTVAADGSVTFTVDGSNFKFAPSELRVKKDQKVKVVFNNVQGLHDFVIDELDVKTSQITAGNTATVEFTPDQTGSFEFYCSVGQHRQNGMKGTLIVE